MSTPLCLRLKALALAQWHGRNIPVLLQIQFGFGGTETKNKLLNETPLHFRQVEQQPYTSKLYLAQQADIANVEPVLQAAACAFLTHMW